MPVTTPTVKINVQGARGESQADILRRTGQYGVLPTDTDEQAMAKLNADAAASAATAEAAAGPNYASTAAGIAATTDGEGFAVDNGDGTVTVYLNDGGTAVEQRTLATTNALAGSAGSAFIGHDYLADPEPGTVASWLGGFEPAAPALGFWKDVGDGARIYQMRDRVFIGGACENDGNLTNITVDWLEEERVSTTNNSQLAVLSTIGQTAILGGSRTSDFSVAGSMGCIGGNFWAINDNTAQVQTAYAVYMEARRYAGAGTTHGFEVDIVNYGDLVSMNPFNMFSSGLTAGAWLASGGEFGSNTASACIAIINNGAAVEKGIVIGATALLGTDGITGSGIAMEVSKGAAIRWVYNGGGPGFSINSDVTNNNAQQKILASDTGLLIRNANNNNLLQVVASDTYVNGLALTPGNTGIGPTLRPIGETNADLRLAGQGTGVVDFVDPVVAGSAGTGAGYFTIKLNGSAYKVQYFNA